MTVLPYGDDAVLVEVVDTAAVVALAAALHSPPVGVIDVVPAALTVVVTFDPARVTRAAITGWIHGARPDSSPRAAGDIVEVPIRYDGDDLDAVAALLGMAPAALVAAHLAATWVVAFTGFAPGFGYLLSDHWPYRVPRLTSPRTRVPAGAVGLADAYCGAYPQATPGGWQLIGTTSAALFDATRTPPALLAPGVRVRFREVSDR